MSIYEDSLCLEEEEAIHRRGSRGRLFRRDSRGSGEGIVKEKPSPAQPSPNIQHPKPFSSFVMIIFMSVWLYGFEFLVYGCSICIFLVVGRAEQRTLLQGRGESTITGQRKEQYYRGGKLYRAGRGN